VVAVTPVQRKRCDLCLAILEIATMASCGSVIRQSFAHSPEECRSSTIQRMRVYEEMHMKDTLEIQRQNVILEGLANMIGATGEILDAGKRWIEHRRQRAEDMRRLRSAFGTNERTMMHPLYVAEEQVAEAIQRGLVLAEKGGAA
jgi:hypothetical protein